MHDYAILGHQRATIGRWLGFASIVLAGGIANLILFVQTKTQYDFLQGSVTVGIVYFCLHYIFDKWAWKIPFFDIPNISGIWIIEGKTLDDKGETTYNWEATLDIEQKWSKISIRLNTKQSQSNSYTATLSKISGTSPLWRLTYSYKNQPKETEIHELNAHKGFCEIEFDKDLQTATANYFNSGARRTFGTMELRKK